MDPTPDRIIRDTFTDKEEAIPFFRAKLPAEVLAVLDLDSIQVMPGTFIDESMKEYRTDVLFQVHTKAHSLTEIYLLFEHKSTPDRAIYTQLLSYLGRIYAQQKDPIPIIPFVFYHGQRQWTLGTEFDGFFRLTTEEAAIFSKYLPNFHFELFNLNTENLDALNLSLFELTLFRIMVHMDRGDLADRLHDIFAVSHTYFYEQKRLEKLRKLLLYIFTRGEIPAPRVAEILARVSQDLEKEAMTTAEQLKAEGETQGFAKGKAEGFAKGRAEGEYQKAQATARAMLREGLDHDLIARVTGLSPEEIERL